MKHNIDWKRSLGKSVPLLTNSGPLRDLASMIINLREQIALKGCSALAQYTEW